jgi:predicted dienelactone hydrolase
VPDFSLREEYRCAVPDDPYRKRADEAGSGRRKPDLKIVSDPRVRAAFVMAPAIGYMFDRAGRSKVEVPVRLYRPTADQMLVHPWHAERIAQMLPKSPEYQLVEGAGHFVFLAPCSALLVASAPAICNDPPGIDRALFMSASTRRMIEFFRRTLTPR